MFYYFKVTIIQNIQIAVKFKVQHIKYKILNYGNYQVNYYYSKIIALLLHFTFQRGVSKMIFTLLVLQVCGKKGVTSSSFSWKNSLTSAQTELNLPIHKLGTQSTTR